MTDAERAFLASLPTRYDRMLDEGAERLFREIHERGLVPLLLLYRQDEILRICRAVEREWLRGESDLSLFADALAEAARRVQTLGDR